MYIWLYRYTYILCLYTYLCNYAYLRISLATGRGPVPGYLHVLSWWHCLQHGFSSNNRHRTPCRAQRELLQHRNIIFVYMFTRIFIYIYILYCIAYYYVSIYTYIIYMYIYIYLFIYICHVWQTNGRFFETCIYFVLYTFFLCLLFSISATENPKSNPFLRLVNVLALPLPTLLAPSTLLYACGIGSGMFRDHHLMALRSGEKQRWP